MGTLWQDLRYSLRTLSRTPGFSMAAILTLALGMGAVSAIFSVVDAVLLRPLPLADPERLVIIWGSNPQQELEESQVSAADFNDWREQGRSFERLALFRARSFNLILGDEPERITGAFVSADFLPVAGVTPMLGRNFLPEEDRPEANNVAILSHSLWQRRFGSDPAVIGSKLTIQGEALTIVGVLPDTLQFTKPLWDLEIDLLVPLGFDPTWERQSRWLWAVGRLRPGVTLMQAQTEMTTISRRLERVFPETNRGWGVELETIHEAIVGDIRETILVVLGTVAFVLLIACANVINLMLARQNHRRSEIGVRVALGASRNRIVRQMLMEGLVLSLLGGATGLLLAHWCIRVLVGIEPTIPRLEEIVVGGRVALFTLLLCVFTLLICGLIPALQASRRGFVAVLREDKRSSASALGGRLRNAVVVSEIALALVLLTGAGLLIRSFERLRSVESGFEAENVLTMTMIPRHEIQEPAGVAAFIREVLERLRALPGVEYAGEINFLPLTDHDAQEVLTIYGRRPASAGEEMRFHFRAISPDYLRTMGIPLVRGRAFTEQDVENPTSVLVNQTAARRFWPGGQPIGERVRYLPDQPWLTVVGIVGDVRHTKLREEPLPEIYFPYTLDTFSTRSFVLKSATDPESLAAAARAAIRSLNKNLPVFDVKTMEQWIEESLVGERLVMLLLTMLAAVASLLAIVGTYGLIAYSVSTRRHEIGVRLALGARARSVVAMVVKEGALLISIGIGCGIVGAWALTRLLSSMLFEISATDPIAFLSSALLLSAVAVLASLVATRKASRTDPMVALRAE